MHDDVQRHNATIEDRHWWFAARRTILRALARELVAPAADALVIDVGCGTGGNSGALAVDYRVVGVDASATAIELARQRFPGARFEVGAGPDVVGGRWREARLVLLMDVIEHVEDDFRMVSELVARTSPGCTFLITVPADPRLWSAHDEASRHWRRYTRARLERVWQELPVEALLVTSFNRLLAPLVRGARALSRLRPPTTRRDAQLTVPAAPLNALLRWTFEREAGPLVRALRSPSRPGWPDGISLLAALRRTEGACAPRDRPPDVAPDDHRPVD